MRRRDGEPVRESASSQGQQFAPIAALVPGDSFFHRLHPAPKLVWVVSIVVFVFLIRNLYILFGLVALVLVLAAASGLLKNFWQSYRVLLTVFLAIIFIQVIAPASLRTTRTAIATLGPIVLYQEGVHNGLVLFSRVFTTMGFSLLVIMTTHPADIFNLFRRLGVPYELGFMTLMTVQLIPIFQQEFVTVVRAQQSRGLKARGFRALAPSVVPVFAGSMERVQQLAMSLESRGFGSSGKKTSLRETKVRPIDIVLSVLGFFVLVGSVVLVILLGNLDTSDVIVATPAVAVALFSSTFLIFLGITFRFLVPSRM